MRQMHGSSIPQLEIMAFANVAGCAQANDGHPGGNGRPDPTRAVFDHETLVRAHAQSASANRKMSGCRNRIRDALAIGNHPVEVKMMAPTVSTPPMKTTYCRRFCIKWTRAAQAG